MPTKFKTRLAEDRAIGLKRCCDCGAYSEAYILSCGNCGGEFPDHTEECPTCANMKLPDEDACAFCLMVWKESPRPYGVSQ